MIGSHRLTSVPIVSAATDMEHLQLIWVGGLSIQEKKCGPLTFKIQPYKGGRVHTTCHLASDDGLGPWGANTQAVDPPLLLPAK